MGAVNLVQGQNVNLKLRCCKLLIIPQFSICQQPTFPTASDLSAGKHSVDFSSGVYY